MLESESNSPQQSFRVHNIFELTCTETPISTNNILKTTTIRTTTTKLKERRQSNLFDSNRILIEDTPTPQLNRKNKEKRFFVGKKKKNPSNKPKTPVLRLPPSASGHSSGSKKIKKLLSKEAAVNDENFASSNSQTDNQTTPKKKISTIFRPKSKQTDDDEEDEQGCDLSYETLKKRERRNNQFVVRLSEIFSNIDFESPKKKSNNRLEVGPSPIVLQRNNSKSNLESTKISTSLISEKNNSLTRVTNDDTSRFEYTVLDEHCHINADNQLVILATQFSNNSDDTNSKKLFIDKTNSLKQKSQEKSNRYSYCSDVSIQDVTIPDSSETTYNQQKTKNRTQFGSTQSPVVISNKTSNYFAKSFKQTTQSTNRRRSSIETNVIQVQQVIVKQPEIVKKSKKLLQINRFLTDDDSLPGCSNKSDTQQRKITSIFKPKVTQTQQAHSDSIPSASPIETSNNNNENNQDNQNSVVYNLTQQDLEFIFESAGEEQIEQRIVSSRTSSKFSSTRNGSLIEQTTTVTKAVATTSKAVMAQPETNRQVVTSRKQPRCKKANQILLSHFNLDSFVDSLNSTFTMTTEKKYNLVFKIGEEIADHVCQLNDKQFYDKTKILCLIKELISKDVNFIPSVINPRLKVITNREQQRQLANSSNSDSDDEDEQQENDLCSKCLQKNRLLTEVCIQCRLFYHKKCEKIKYIPVNGWICTKCKSKKT